MINNIKNLLVILVAWTTLTGDAYAGELLGDGDQATASLYFRQDVDATNELTPVTGLKAGTQENTVDIANGTLAASDEGSHQYAIAISNGEESANNWKIKGKNGSTLVVYITFISRGGGSDQEVMINDTHYTVSPESATSADYRVVLPAGKKLSADIYTIKTKAYIYTE